MQCLAGLAILAVDFMPVHRSRATVEGGQPPATRVEAEHKREAAGDFHAARDFIPMRGNQQNDSRRDQHRADDGDDGEELIAAVFLELELLDDFLALVVGDETGIVEFLNVTVFHNCPLQMPRVKRARHGWSCVLIL